MIINTHTRTYTQTNPRVQAHRVTECLSLKTKTDKQTDIRVRILVPKHLQKEQLNYNVQVSDENLNICKNHNFFI